MGGAAAALGGIMIQSTPQPIQWRHMVEWCAHHGIAGEDEEQMVRLISDMDQAFLAWWRERNDRK